MKDKPEFHLMFDPSELSKYADRYPQEDDELALEAGRRIAAGEYSRANLSTIFKWKTGGRGAVRLAKNTDEEIADSLRLALDAITDRCAIAVLTGLCGVHVPVASAIMTVLKPKTYTIIDYRALEALSYVGNYHSIEFYLLYLLFCRQLARRLGIDLRRLDRALWQWSKEKNDGLVV
jgi:hypothetical protein